jgi:PAS domain S-box-containing protein
MFKESETDLLLSHFALESLNDAIFWVDSSGSIFQVNEMACNMSGYSKEELTHMHMLDIDPSQLAGDFPKFLQQLKKEKKITFEAQHKHKSGLLYDVEITGNYIKFKGQELTCSIVRDLRKKRMEEQLLRRVSEATSGLTGKDFLFELTRNLTQTLGMRYAFIAECTDKTRTRFRTIAFAEGQNILDNIEYDAKGSACSEMLKGEPCFIPANVQEKFNAAKGIEAYIGVPIISPTTGEMLGHIAATDIEPVTEEKNQTAILKIFAARIAAELERLQAQNELEEKNRELNEHINQIELYNSTVKNLKDQVFWVDRLGKFGLMKQSVTKRVIPLKN